MDVVNLEMVRETRYLLIGNLPEKTTEEEINEYFKRYGKIQTVKLQPRPESPKDKEAEEGESFPTNTLSATVAFMDIKSASKAHKAEKKIGVLTSEYSEGLHHVHKATGRVVTRTRAPEMYLRVAPPPGPAAGFPTRKGSMERNSVPSTVTQKCKEVENVEKDDIEPREREPLGVYITKLPLRSSDTSLRDGLFREYKKYGKVTAVQVSGVSEGRCAIVSFALAEDAAKALIASHDTTFFGSRIVASQHEGLEVDVDSSKSTRTLFIGNLNNETRSVEELKERLGKYGEILDVDVKRSGSETAYAFVQFSDITSVVNCLRDLEGQNWDGIKLKVGFGKSKASPVIWLENLADTVNESFLCRKFCRYGGISHAVVDRVKGRGLVFFITIKCAQYALPEMRNRIWNGKKIHIDFASRDCQDAFFKKMEESGQLRVGDRPEPWTWINKPMVGGEPQTWDDKDDEYSVSSGPYPGYDVPYEEALSEYGHSQRERRERPHCPSNYEDAYYEIGSQSGRDYDIYDKPRYEYRSLSPGRDREMDVTDDEFKFKSRTADDRYYYKDKYFEQETKSRDRSQCSDSEQRYRVASEIVTTHSQSWSPTTKHKRAEDLPISYRSQSPPTPTDVEPQYYHNSRDHSHTDFDSAFRKYEDYKKSSSVDGDKHRMNISRRGYVQLGMNMPNQQQQQELLQLERLVAAQQATNLAMAEMADGQAITSPPKLQKLSSGAYALEDAGQSREQAKHSRTRNDSHSEDRHRDKPHTQQIDNTNREGQRQRRQQSRWDSRPSESPKWARDMSPERGRQSDGRQRESPPRSREMRDRARGDTRDQQRDNREPSGDRRSSASGGGREGDSQQAGKRMGDYSNYKQDDGKKRYREPQQGGSHGYRGHMEDNI